MKKIDEELIGLIEKRMGLLAGELFPEGKKDFPDSDSYPQEKIAQCINSLEGIEGLSGQSLKAIYRAMIFEAIRKVRPVSVAFLGPVGTFSHQALQEIFGNHTTSLPQKTIHDVFREAEKGRADFGVVPVENSTEGAVTFTLDELIETDLSIMAEKFVRISYCLVSGEDSIAAIKKVFAHPQTVGQCKEWIRKNLSDAEIIHVDSTSRAAAMALEHGGSAGISAGITSEIYGLNVLATEIEDLRQNYTRFLALGRKKNSRTGKDKTSIVCAVKDKPSALLSLISPISTAEINMTKIESRPDKKKIWEYNFFIDFTGHKDDENVKKALAQVREETVYLKILGSYPSDG